MGEVDDSWAADLSRTVARTLDEFRPHFAGRVAILAVDCHPWEGTLDLAILTTAEVAADPLLAVPAEMAAWQHFHFASRLASWQPATELARQMRGRYDLADGRRAAVAEGYLRACASALATATVQGAIAKYDLAADFHCSVPHPDTDAEYYPPG